MKHIAHCTLVITAAAALLAPVRAAADEATSQIAFSDPAKPGTIKIHILHGDVTIHGADVKDVTVRSDATAASPTPRKDGLRVLSSTSGYLLNEKGNVVTLEYGSDGWSGGSTDFDITVPRTASVNVSNSGHGDVDCTGVGGDIDVRTMSGDVSLDDVAGGALVETMNGEIKVNVKELRDSRPLSFTSMHGEISIHVPDAAKADIRFRTHHGVILTNFDDKALVTRTEITSYHTSKQDKKHSDMVSSDGATISAPAAPAAPVAAAAPVAPAAPAASADSDEDWRSDVRESVREAAREASEATREAAQAVQEGLADFHMQQMSIMAPLPPMTGGKVVSGKLNGGGVEIQAATLTGDIVLRKSE